MADSDVDEEYVPEASSSRASTSTKMRALSSKGRATNISKPKGLQKKNTPSCEAKALLPATLQKFAEIFKLKPLDWLIRLANKPGDYNKKPCRLCGKVDSVMIRHVLAWHTIPLGKVFIGAEKQWAKYCTKKYVTVSDAERHLLFALLVIPSAQKETSASLKAEVDRFMELYSSWVPSISQGPTPLPYFDFADRQWAGLREFAEKHAAVIGWTCKCGERFNRGDVLVRHRDTCAG